MRVLCIIIGGLAALLLVLGLANGVWTAMNLTDGSCDGCIFPGMNEMGEVVATTIVNLILYGGIIALALWGFRQKPTPPRDQESD